MKGLSNLLLLTLFFGLFYYAFMDAKEKYKAPKFSVGDCIQLDVTLEKWEDADIFKVIAVGKEKYTYTMCSNYVCSSTNVNISFVDKAYVKVKCK